MMLSTETIVAYFSVFYLFCLHVIMIIYLKEFGVFLFVS